MISYQAGLAIDFGEIGYWKSKQPFRVRLDTSALAELIDSAENAYRVYELMLIDRPGDVWDYVWVVIEAVSGRVAARVKHAHEDAKTHYGDDHPWPEDRIPFTVFDGLFYWGWDDTEPEDEAWLSHRNAPTMHAFAQQLLAMVRAAQCHLDWNDQLLHHEVARIRSSEHPYGYLERRSAIKKGQENQPNSSNHTPAFYKQLDKLLNDPELASIAYRSAGDYQVLRMIATEQRRRANKTKHSVDHALHLSVLTIHEISNEAWDSELHFSNDRLYYGDLLINGGDCDRLGGNDLKLLLEERRIRFPGRYIFSTKDEGSIEGFDIESGDGWVLYSKHIPDGRRRGLERIEAHHTPLGPVLNFGGQATTLYDFDKTVIVVGEDVSDSVRSALAMSVVEWQQHGGDPVLVVLGDTRPFEIVGCRDLLQPAVKSEQIESISHADWLRSVLRQVRPWIDVIILLDAPVWATQVLAEVSSFKDLWSPWVVTSSCVEHLKANLVLESDLAVTLLEAHLRARMMRPQL